MKLLFFCATLPLFFHKSVTKNMSTEVKNEMKKSL